jgi:hypothetical protein
VTRVNTRETADIERGRAGARRRTPRKDEARQQEEEADPRVTVGEDVACDAKVTTAQVKVIAEDE